MKNRVICLFALAIIFFLPGQANAAFVVKKHVTTQANSVFATTNTNNNIVVEKNDATPASPIIQQFAHPSFSSMMGRGTIGLIAAICGVLGLFVPIFSIGAILLGFLGLGRRNRNRGFAIFGLVLGIAAIIMSI